MHTHTNISTQTIYASRCHTHWAHFRDHSLPLTTLEHTRPGVPYADAQYSPAPTGTDQFQEGAWMWMAGKDVSTPFHGGYTNWATRDGEPNNLNPDYTGPANCVRISFPAPFLWRDVVRP